MKFTKVEAPGGQAIAVVTGSEFAIEDAQSALSLVATAGYESGCDRIVIDKSLVAESFFDLKTGVAGEVLQKFANYHVKAAIVGDFSGYASQSLKDFIYECNKGKHVFFVSTEQEAIEKLSAAE